MNRNVVIGIVVVIALAVVGWWYFAMMPKSDVSTATPEASVNGIAVPAEQAAFTLAGTWRSDDDARFIRVFQSDGTITDRYEGDDSATISGSWNFVEDPSKEQAELPVVKDARVIKVQFPEEVMYFAILELSDTSLSMSYLAGAGGSLNFTRVR